jgi:hypothetical protein
LGKAVDVPRTNKHGRQKKSNSPHFFLSCVP